MAALVDGGTLDARVRFADGAAGLFWSLAYVGAEVPALGADRLVQRASAASMAGPGLAAGYSGVALALDGVGHHDEADQFWHDAEVFPLDRLGVTVADGLAGVGLALLERAPVRDAEELFARLDTIAEALVAQLVSGHRLIRPGILFGYSGPALYLLHAYGLTGDASLLRAVEHCLRHDLDLLGWSPGAGRPLRHAPTGGVATGLPGIAMVLHEAARHLDASWIAAARDDLLATCQDHAAHPLTRRGVGTVLAVEYVRRTAQGRPDPARPETPTEVPRAVTPRPRHPRPVEARLRHLRAGAARLRHPREARPRIRTPQHIAVSLAAPVLHTAHYLHAEQEPRMAFFW
ncbi:hypothetical protein GCM10009790_08720 [Georgenia ruanii]|uniref:Lanthionine synthetase n=1 Tax=Georgenia ruanii TaxID=348442 RepID=A0A7J9USM1_9MICO|nr:hypothetical protein [Georgenia ruanii]